MADGKKATGRTGARFHGRYANEERPCDWPQCSDHGEFRAPPLEASSGGSRYDGPGKWRWFCLEHVRMFNAGYNYFAGMSPDEIYEAQRPHSGWERETRAFASAPVDAPAWANFQDPLDAIGARFKDNLNQRSQAGRGQAAAPKYAPAIMKALKTLGLDDKADMPTIRRRYSILVRQYHPDRNGGDRSHEKKLQAVIDARQVLRDAGILGPKAK
jgi:hypothetical protein